MAETPEEHYTATVEVPTAVGPQQPKNTRGYAEGEPTKRKVVEVARMAELKPVPEVNSVVITIGGRKIAWRASDNVIAPIAQSLVQVLGPGEEVQ